jgi:Putative MetA-pathway of phenol degradation
MIKSRNGPAKKTISTPTGRTFRRRARRSAKAAPSWSRVTRSPRKAIPFFPIPARKRCSAPTGSGEVTARKVLPGVNVDFGWEVVKDVFNIELLIANNFVQDDLETSSHHELATGLTVAFQLTKKLEFFAEWDAFYPTGGLHSAAPRNYAVAGLVYFVTSDFQLDMRAGVGLDHASNDFLAGVGFAARY